MQVCEFLDIFLDFLYYNEYIFMISLKFSCVFCTKNNTIFMHYKGIKFLKIVVKEMWDILCMD